MDAFADYLKFQKEVAESKIKIIERFQKETKEGPTKRTSSKIDVARNVLYDAGKPLHVTEIIRFAKRDYHVDLERDSIVSAILKKVKADQTFIRTGPNTFALQNYTER